MRTTFLKMHIWRQRSYSSEWPQHRKMFAREVAAGG